MCLRVLLGTAGWSEGTLGYSWVLPDGTLGYSWVLSEGTLKGILRQGGERCAEKGTAGYSKVL